MRGRRFKEGLQKPLPPLSIQNDIAPRRLDETRVSR
jgi:hypothetical protein